MLNSSQQYKTYVVLYFFTQKISFRNKYFFKIFFWEYLSLLNKLKFERNAISLNPHNAMTSKTRQSKQCGFCIYLIDNSFVQLKWLEWSGWSLWLGCWGWSGCSGKGGQGSELCKSAMKNWSLSNVVWCGVVCCALV